jgi:hypothetical protein
VSGYRADIEALSTQATDVIDQIRALLLNRRDDPAKYDAVQELLREMKQIRAECAEVLAAMHNQCILDYAMALKKMRASLKSVLIKLAVEAN